MKNERVDELIDRVAAELVDSSHDPSFTLRLRARLQSRSHQVSPRLILAATVSAAVMLAIVVITMRDLASPDASTNGNFVTSTALALRAPLTPFAPAAPLAPLARLAPRAPARPASTTVVIESLEIAPLDDIALDVGALEVAALTLADLEDADAGEKEPR